MSASRYAFDGLWRCLCPSADPITAYVALHAPTLSRVSLSPLAVHSTKRRRSQREACHNTRSSLPRTQCRSYGTAVASRVATPTTPNPSFREVSHPSNNNNHVGVPSETPMHTHVLRAIMKGRLNPPTLDEEMLKAASTGDLLEALHDLQTLPHSFPVAVAIVEHLIRDRGQKPSPLLYESLMACARDTKGSADTLAQLLSEMKILRLGVGSRLCHIALQVLAVHPNYLLRNEILAAMKESWTETDVLGHCSVCLGLLRDGQYELAFDKFESTVSEYREKVPPWLFDVFILSLMQKGFLDEAIRLAHDKLPLMAEDVALPLWSQLLDACSRMYHCNGTIYIWRRFCKADKAQLSDGTLLNVLNTAARYGEPDMAADAIHLLSQRGVRLGPHHYEALIDAYAEHGDLHHAFRVLCIMTKALSVTTPANTRSIYALLRTNSSLLDDALDALQALKMEYDVPVEAANVVLEAMVAVDESEKAAQVFAKWHQFTESQPNMTTYGLLLADEDFPDAECLKVLVARDAKTALKVNLHAFTRAVYEFTVAGDLDSAYMCTKMISGGRGGSVPPSVPSATAAALSTSPNSTSGSTLPSTRIQRQREVQSDEEQGEEKPEHTWLPRDTALELVKKSLDVQDERVWWLLEEAKRQGVDVQSSLSKIVSSLEGDEGEGVNAPSRAEVTKGRRIVALDDEGNITLV